MLGNMMGPHSFSGLKTPLLRKLLTHNWENNLPKSFTESQGQYLLFIHFLENDRIQSHTDLDHYMSNYQNIADCQNEVYKPNLATASWEKKYCVKVLCGFKVHNAE